MVKFFPAQLWSNADEADLRVWLHCIHSTGTQEPLLILMYIMWGYTPCTRRVIVKPEATKLRICLANLGQNAEPAASDKVVGI